MATMNYVCSTSNGERTFIGCQSAREGGIGKFIDDFQKDIQIWFQFPLSKEGRKEGMEGSERNRQNRKSTTASFMACGRMAPKLDGEFLNVS